MNRFYIVTILLSSLFFPASVGLADLDMPLLRTMNTEYANSYAKDLFADAPWFIRDSSVPLPVIFIIKDADVMDLEELQGLYVEIDVDGNSDFAVTDTLFSRVYDPVRYDMDDYYWDTLVFVDVSEGYGNRLFIRASIDYEDYMPWDEMYSQVLSVQVGHGEFPKLPNWYVGDCHFHTIITMNPYESGGNFPMIQACALGMGLDFVTTTDHASDSSYFLGVLIDDLNESDWLTLPDSFAIYGSENLIFLRGEEADIANELGDTRNHYLIYGNNDFFSAPIPETEAVVSFGEAVQFLLDSPEAISYAAHPADPDYLWADEIIDSGIRSGVLTGLQIWNERRVWERDVDADEYMNPFPFSYGDMTGRDGHWDSDLLDGIETWHQFLWQGLSGPDDPRKIFISGGSDAHGDFNYFTYNRMISGVPTPDIWTTDNAFAKVRTLVNCPDGASSEAILDGLRNGRTVATDGPALDLRYFATEGFTGIGESDTIAGDGSDSLMISWLNTIDFGGAAKSLFLTLIYGDEMTVENVDIEIPEDRLYHRMKLPLPVPIERGWFALRAEIRTFLDDEQYIKPDSSFRAITNPIWFFVLSDPMAASEREEARRLFLNISPNPFNLGCGIRTDNNARIEIFDILGRKLADLGRQRHWQPSAELRSGVYLVRATLGSREIIRKAVYIR